MGLIPCGLVHTVALQLPMIIMKAPLQDSTHHEGILDCIRMGHMEIWFVDSRAVAQHPVWFRCCSCGQQEVELEQWGNCSQELTLVLLSSHQQCISEEEVLVIHSAYNSWEEVGRSDQVGSTQAHD